jgi:hypothetical protein
MKRLNNLYEEFQKIPSIEEHFQVTGHTFSLERKDETTFQFNMTVNTPVLELNIPDVLIEHIKSYLLDGALIEIKYPKDYPFKCPKFSLIRGIEKYNKALCMLNYEYDMDWSPAITFEKDILYLIQYII